MVHPISGHACRRGTLPRGKVKSGCQENVNNFEGQAVLWRKPSRVEGR